MFASAAGLTLPGSVSEPPINVTLMPESFRSGALRNTVAIVVIAPVGTMVKSGPHSRAAAMMKSTAEPGASGCLGESGSTAPPIPLGWCTATEPGLGDHGVSVCHPSSPPSCQRRYASARSSGVVPRINGNFAGAMGWSMPGYTGMSSRPNAWSTASALRAARGTATLPYVAVMPMRSASPALPSA